MNHVYQHSKPIPAAASAGMQGRYLLCSICCRWRQWLAGCDVRVVHWLGHTITPRECDVQKRMGLFRLHLSIAKVLEVLTPSHDSAALSLPAWQTAIFHVGQPRGDRHVGQVCGKGALGAGPNATAMAACECRIHVPSMAALFKCMATLFDWMSFGSLVQQCVALVGSYNSVLLWFTRTAVCCLTAQ